MNWNITEQKILKEGPLASTSSVSYFLFDVSFRLENHEAQKICYLSDDMQNLVANYGKFIKPFSSAAAELVSPFL